MQNKKKAFLYPKEADFLKFFYSHLIVSMNLKFRKRQFA